MAHFEGAFLELSPKELRSFRDAILRPSEEAAKLMDKFLTYVDYAVIATYDDGSVVIEFQTEKGVLDETM